MALRFQNGRDDEIDQAAKDERATPILIFLLVVFASIQGVFAWIKGESLASYGKDVAWWVGFGFAYWLISPFYFEFRIRTKEIDGKVSAIERVVNASKEAQAELLEKLAAVEDKLGELADKVESMNPGADAAYSPGGIRAGLRIIEELSGRTDPQR